jgi:hypothetical protein
MFVTMDPTRITLMAERGRKAAFGVALACGAGIWLLSPLITARAEPWDAAGGYYPGALFLTGLAGGLAFPAHPAMVALGIIGGQVVVLLGRVAADPGGGGLWPLGLLFLVGYGVIALLGAALGAAGGHLRARRRRPDET